MFTTLSKVLYRFCAVAENTPVINPFMEYTKKKERREW